MRRMLLPALALLALTTPGISKAQAPPDGSAHRSAIDSLDFMVGRWVGDAWSMRGPGNKVETTMTETVELKLGGVVLQVEGVGVVPATDSAPARVVHHALAVISFDTATGTYGMRSYIATGQYGDFVLNRIAGGVSWTLPVPGGQIRNTAHIAGDTWHEIGEFSRDGVNWSQTMEMNLRRER